VVLGVKIELMPSPRTPSRFRFAQRDHDIRISAMGHNSVRTSSMNRCGLRDSVHVK
jgi:hypothetical protein